jgi:hypothetical protein
MKKVKYKAGDVVLVKSSAGDVIPDIHVRLLRRVEVPLVKGKTHGFHKQPDYGGYSGWDATPIFKEEMDALRKDWGIPFETPEVDETWVFDYEIVKKPRNPTPNIKKKISSKRRTVLRKKKTC